MQFNNAVSCSLCKLITIAQLRYLEGEICRTFHVVLKEQTNAWNSRARVVLPPFSDFEGRDKS